MRYITIDEANRYLRAGWEDRNPSIDVGGSVRGMINRFGWKRGHAFRIGSYIYHFDSYDFETALRICKG